MIEDSKAKSVIRKYNALKGRHNMWQGIWQEVADLVLPHRNFLGPTGPAERRNLKIYDGTAPWALDQLAAGLHGYLTSPTQRFMKMGVDNPDIMKREEVKRWANHATDQCFAVFNSAASQFHQQLHELYLDVGAFGTGIQFVGEDMGMFKFRTYPLSQCYIDEGANGMVDTVFRCFSFTARQAVQMFGEKCPAKIAECEIKEPNRVFELAHGVFPRTDRITRMSDTMNKPFASFYFWPEGGVIIDEGGYDEMPYKVPRWTKMSGEIYGRSPAISCLPDIKMVNKMAETIIRAGQKVVDPPLMVPDDGFLVPIRTTPGALLRYRSGTNDRIEPLQTGGRVDIGLDMMNQRREHIIRSFYVDWMQNQKQVEQTATEVLQGAEERMRLMAPMVARLQSEYLSPTIMRVYNLLLKKRYIQPPPEILREEGVKIQYVSPVVRAQKMVQAASVTRAIESLAPIAQIKPDVLDHLDSDGYTKWLLDLHDAPNEVIAKENLVKQIREQRQQAAEQQAQAEQAAQTAETASKMANVIPMQGRG